MSCTSNLRYRIPPPDGKTPQQIGFPPRLHRSVGIGGREAKTTKKMVVHEEGCVVKVTTALEARMQTL